MPTFADMAGLQSWLASDLSAYLAALRRRMLEQPLLNEIVGGEIGEFWMPLRCTRDAKLFARSSAAAQSMSPDASVADESAFRRQAGFIDSLGGAESSQPVHRFISAEAFVAEQAAQAESTATVILGDPGSGKTELLRRRTRQEAKQQLDDLHGHLREPGELCPPLFVAFKSLASLLSPSAPQREALEEMTAAINGFPPARNGISAELRQCLIYLLTAAEEWPRESGRLLAHLLGQWLQIGDAGKGRPFLLCLDGWDEVRGTDREKVAKLLLPLFRAISKREGRGLDRLQIIVASRVYGFDYHLLPFGRCGYLVPFQPSDIIRYVRQFFTMMPGSGSQAAAGLEKQLHRHQSVNESCANPMVLTLLCCLFHDASAESTGRRFNAPVIPGTRVELYYQVLQRLTGRAARIHKGISTEGADARADQKLGALAKAAALAFPESALKESLLRGCFPDQELFEEVMRSDAVLRAAGQREGEMEFLHLTFQEYLTAAHLVEREDLPERLIDAAMTPSSAQVMRMALGLASVARPGQFALGKPAFSFGKLVEALASPGRQPRPGFTSLMLASAASDLGPLQEEDAGVLLETLFADWASAQSSQSSDILSGPLEAAFQKLHRGLNQSAVEDFLCRNLGTSDRAPLTARLLAKAGISLAGRESIKKVCAAVERDQPGLSWPIHTYLAIQIATSPTKLFAINPVEAADDESQNLRGWIDQHQIEPQEIEAETRWGTSTYSHLASTLTDRIALRRLLLRSSEADACVAHIDGSCELQMLVGIFFGGLDNLRLVECLEQFIDAQRRFSSSEHLGRRGQRHQAACELDVAIIPWRDAIRKKGVRFDPGKIFIRSALDERLTGWIRQRLPTERILDALRVLAADASEPVPVRAEASLAIYCLGSGPLATVLTDLPENVRAYADQRAMLLRAMTVDAVLRAAPVAVEAICSRTDDPMLPAERVRELRLVHHVNRIYGGLPMGLASVTPDHFGTLQYSELLARALSGFEDDNPEYPEDVVYNLAVVLDTIGRKLGVPNCLVDRMRALPFTENSRNEAAPSWLGWDSCDPALAGETFQAATDSSPAVLRRNLGVCIDAIYRGATATDFFRGWALACLMPVLRETCPGLVMEAVFYATRSLPEDCYESRGMVLRAAERPDGANASEVMEAARENLAEWPAVSARLLIGLAACQANDEEALVNQALAALERVENAGERGDLLASLARVCRRSDTLRAVLAAHGAVPPPPPESAGGGEPSEDLRCTGGSFAESLLGGAWRLHGYMHDRGLETGLDALWRRSLQNPEDAESRQQLGEAATEQGFTLTRTRIIPLEAALASHGVAAVRDFLKIPRRASNCAVVTLLRWLHESSDTAFQNSCAVLLMELGVLNPAVAARLTEIALSSDDSVRQRMRQALAPGGDFRCGWRLSVVGLETALLVQAAAEHFLVSQPGIASYFSGFAGTLQCDDAEAFSILCERAAADVHSTTGHLLVDLQRLDADSFARMIDFLEAGPPPLQALVLQVCACLRQIPAEPQRAKTLLGAAEDALEEIVRSGSPALATESLRAYETLSSRFSRLSEERKAAGLRRMLRAGVQRGSSLGNTVSAHYLHALGRLVLPVSPGDRNALLACLTPGAPPPAAGRDDDWFALMRKLVSDPGVPAARVAAVSLLIEAKMEEAAGKAADGLGAEAMIQIISTLLDTYLYVQTRESHTKVCAQLLLKNSHWLRRVVRHLVESLARHPDDRRVAYGLNGDPDASRYSLLAVIGQYVQMGGDLEKAFADDQEMIAQIAAAAGECLTLHDSGRGRRAVLHLLHALPAGAEVILDHMTDLSRDAPTVTGAILGASDLRFSASMTGRLIAQFEEKVEQGSALELAYSTLLLGNHLLAGGTGASAKLWKRLFALIDRFPNAKFYGIQSGDLSPVVIVSSIPLRRWVNERICQMLHLVDILPYRPLVPYVVFDAPLQAIFVDPPTTLFSTVQLLVSERPQKGKRAAEYQLRFFGETFFGSRTMNTDPWFKNVSERAEKATQSMRNLFKFAMRGVDAKP